MRIIREHRCEDDFSWDRVRRSTVFPKIRHITGTVCRERMREKNSKDVSSSKTETSPDTEKELLEDKTDKK